MGCTAPNPGPFPALVEDVGERENRIGVSLIALLTLGPVSAGCSSNIDEEAQGNPLPSADGGPFGFLDAGEPDADPDVLGQPGYAPVERDRILDTQPVDTRGVGVAAP